MPLENFELKKSFHFEIVGTECPNLELCAINSKPIITVDPSVVPGTISTTIFLYVCFISYCLGVWDGRAYVERLRWK